MQGIRATVGGSKLLSRQSCAYKKELRIKLKEGVDLETAKAAARKVSAQKGERRRA